MRPWRAAADARTSSRQAIDPNSSLIRGRQLQFDSDGRVDPNCPAVRDGDVLINKDGTIDKRSKALKRPALQFFESRVSSQPDRTHSTAVSTAAARHHQPPQQRLSPLLLPKLLPMKQPLSQLFNDSNISAQLADC